MMSLKRMGMFTLVLAALAMPSASNASVWHPYTKPEQSVPEPGAAALFALGAAVVAARTRKSR